MSEHYVTRGEIIQKLKQWQAAQIDTQQLWDWASHRFSSAQLDYDDSEDEGSVAAQVLEWLDSLDMHCVLVEDATIHLDFLATPLGAFEDGYRQWQQALQEIDMAARHRRLKDDPMYALFCR